jgi:hypothetical protein
MARVEKCKVTSTYICLYLEISTIDPSGHPKKYKGGRGQERAFFGGESQVALN